VADVAAECCAGAGAPTLRRIACRDASPSSEEATPYQAG